MGYTIGFFADTHLGYESGTSVDPATGLNQRVRDGYDALKETVDAMIAAEVDLVIQGGDLFHVPKPTAVDVKFANRQLRRLADAEIPTVINTGNHDAPGRHGDGAAVLYVEDPSRGITSVATPYREINIADGLRLHVISHYGLAQEQRVVPEPVDGDINILTAHGTAQIPGHEIFACAETMREQPVSFELLSDTRYASTLLGHYHSQEALPNLPHAWYAGSALRRGFSDKAGQRGWLKVTVNDDGTITVSQEAIHQRPQVDLPPVDATGLTRDEIVEAIMGNIAAMGIDPAGAIVRQKVTEVLPDQREAVRDPRIREATRDMLEWKVQVTTRARSFIPVDDGTEGEPGDGEDASASAAHSISTAAGADLVGGFRSWAPVWLTEEQIPADRHEAVVDAASKIIEDVVPTATAEALLDEADGEADDTAAEADSAPEDVMDDSEPLPAPADDDALPEPPTATDTPF